MTLFQTLVLASFLGYNGVVVAGEKKHVCPKGSLDGTPMPCYDAGNSTISPDVDSTGSAYFPIPIVHTMISQASLLGPGRRTTTTPPAPPQPTPNVVCKCVEPDTNFDMQDQYNYPDPSSRGQVVPIVGIMKTQVSLRHPTGCTTTCMTAYETYQSPRIERTRSSPIELLSPHMETTDAALKEMPSSRRTTPPPGPPPPPMTTPPPALPHPLATAEALITAPPHYPPPAQVPKQNQLPNQPQSTFTPQYIIHAIATLVPGGSPAVVHGTTYSIPQITGPAEPTVPAVVYVNGEPKPVDQVPGVQIGSGISGYINQGIGGENGGGGGGGGAEGNGNVTMTESVAYTTVGGVPYYSPRLHISQTQLIVPQKPSASGLGNSSTLATMTAKASTTGTSRTTSTGTESANGGQETSSGGTGQQTGSAAGRMTVSAVCLVAVVFATLML